LKLFSPDQMIETSRLIFVSIYLDPLFAVNMFSLLPYSLASILDENCDYFSQNLLLPLQMIWLKEIPLSF